MNFIPISQPSITQLEIDYVNDAVRSGWVSSLGEYITKFENEFASFCGTKYALSVSNATVGLHLSLVALGIGKDDEVIIPDLTFVATGNVVKYVNAKPIIVDIDPDTLCMDANGINKAITKNTRAIIPVHLYGHPADMSKINEIAKENNLLVIEDAAEAHGAEIDGRRVGSFGDVGVFSFYGNKIITSGEGGMITTNNKNLYERLKFLRDHAMSSEKRYWHTEVGFNYRMTNLQAALGLAQLRRIEDLIQKRIEIFEWYKEGLFGAENISLNRTQAGIKNVYWMICLEISGYTEKQRDDFLVKLKEKGIDGRPYFYPLSDMPIFDSVNTYNAHNIYKTGLNLPSFFDITKEQVLSICKTIKEILYEK